MPTVRAEAENIDGGKKQKMSDYQDRYREKLMDAASVAARVEDGWVIGMDAATAHTPRIMSALAARAAAGEVKNVKVQTLREETGTLSRALDAEPDAEQIEKLARDRLGLVMPNETIYYFTEEDSTKQKEG